MLSFGQSFISDHIGTDNQYCLLLLSKTWVKTKSLGCTNNTKWKKMNFKNLITKLTRYYFHDIVIKLENFGIYKISIGKKSQEYVLTYIISHETLIDPYIFSHYYAKIKFDSYDSLPMGKIWTLHNVVIHIKSVQNKDKNHYCYKIFLEKCSLFLGKC